MGEIEFWVEPQFTILCGPPYIFMFSPLQLYSHCQHEIRSVPYNFIFTASMKFVPAMGNKKFSVTICPP
jgi:hypothetical protein